MTKDEFIKKLQKLDDFFTEGEDLDMLYEHLETMIHEYARLEDLEDTTIEMQAYIDILREMQSEMQKIVKQTRRENDHKLRAIWLMAEEIKNLRNYTFVDNHQWINITENIVKEYLDEAKLSRDDDGDHIPRID